MDKLLDNKQIGASSIVMKTMLHGVKCPLNDDAPYDARVSITVLPTNKLADFKDIGRQLLSHEGEVHTLEQLAAVIHRDIKAFYSNGKDYSAKAEVIVEREEDELNSMGVRVHVAG
jgi:hypothetical protein